jgi:hypothetical protein
MILSSVLNGRRIMTVSDSTVHINMFLCDALFFAALAARAIASSSLASTPEKRDSV